MDIPLDFSRHAFRRFEQRFPRAAKRQSLPGLFVQSICVSQYLNRRVWLNQNARAVLITVDLFDDATLAPKRLIVTVMRLGRLQHALKLVSNKQGAWYE